MIIQKTSFSGGKKENPTLQPPPKAGVATSAIPPSLTLAATSGEL
jgi:hypothetical protein